MKKNIVRINVKSTMTRCPDSGRYVIVNKNTKENIVVMSDEDPLVAMKKFKEAMQMAYVIKNLFGFEKNCNWYIPKFE